ncbi:UDP-N-acetylglucosamine 1-carboxyvinyltransferase [Candidatus Saccharibacteria bacterium]|nr:UDP-N-acetylglucosamine 1-carboxyvinyltransferase [Candidatus Saccharibacteria bacterium]
MSDIQQEIAERIKTLRQQKGLTQSNLAKLLKTSQSAVTRMEAGQQNFSLEMLDRMSNALGNDLVTIPDGTMNFEINGGKQLSGNFKIKSSKNAAVALLVASLLNKGTTTLQSVPKIEEVYRIIEVLKSIGVSIDWQHTNLVIKPPKKLRLDKIDVEAARRTRTIIMFLGPLMHIMDEFELPFAGGCKLGHRSVKPHIFALEPFGLKAKDRTTTYDITVKKNAPGEIVLFEMGDTVTENALMAAARTPGKTIIKFASSNYMVQDLCFYLEKLGIEIEGIGTSTLTVHGVSEIDRDVTYAPSEDPIEAMMMISLAITTDSEITITCAPIDFLELELLYLQKMNFKYTLSPVYLAKNNRTKLVDITTKHSKLQAISSKVAAGPYPAINIDNLPFFVPIAASAEGQTLVHDWVYENRAIYYTELSKLGAKVDLADPHRLFVTGPTEWQSAEVVSPPALRPSALILIGMIAAPGRSLLRNVYSINRGYESLAERLNGIGADIKIVE